MYIIISLCRCCLIKILLSKWYIDTEILLQSSLLQLILRELPLFEGKLLVRGKISYASQEPWLFGGSIQQNILFNSPMDEVRYKKVNIYI